MREKPDRELAAEFEALLAATDKDENNIQDFIEHHTEFLPTPFLLNHQLHMRCVISKFPVGGRTADFAYLTKSSDRWRLVLVELEGPHKSLFSASSKHHKPSAKFSDALAQTDIWREHFEDHSAEVKERLRPILVPPNMFRNQLTLRRVLIIGRSKEKDTHEARRRRFASIAEQQDVEIMTYDTLLTHYRSGHGSKKCILSPRSPGFSIKRVDGLPKILFAYVHPEHLEVPAESERALKAAGYQIDAWRDGRMLIFNEKYASEAIEDTEEDLHPATVAVMDAARKGLRKGRRK